jgi:hypothetical protein
MLKYVFQCRDADFDQVKSGGVVIQGMGKTNVQVTHDGKAKIEHHGLLKEEGAHYGVF